VEVTVYDYGMNRVWSTSQRKSAGQQETVWDGTDDRGLRVPTGTYFYQVEFGDTTAQGKILLAN
jgi:flagellar hook assembly protein FlgD